MVLNAVINKKQYLDHERLVLGSYRLEEEETCNLLLAYTKMYGKSGPTRTLTHEDIEKIYKWEVIDLAKKGTYCRLWSLHFTANVLGLTINVWFPDADFPGFDLSCHILHQSIKPLTPLQHLPFAAAVTIMWTKSHHDANSFNHFIPVVHVSFVLNTL